MKELFIARISYNRNTVMRLSKTIYNVYGGKTKTAIAAGGLMLAVCGFFSGINTPAGISLVATACLLLSQIQYPAVYRARQVVEAFHGNLPEISYHFRKADFAMYIGESEKIYPYSTLINLVEDSEYLYLFPDHSTAFTLDKNNFQKGTADDFMQFLSNQTSLGWNHYRPFWMLNLSDILRKIQKNGK